MGKPVADSDHVVLLSLRLLAQINFQWSIEFNGWSESPVHVTYDADNFPETIDSIAIAYTNSRGITSLQLKQVSS